MVRSNFIKLVSVYERFINFSGSPLLQRSSLINWNTFEKIFQPEVYYYQVICNYFKDDLEDIKGEKRNSGIKLKRVNPREEAKNKIENNAKQSFLKRGVGVCLCFAKATTDALSRCRRCRI